MARPPEPLASQNDGLGAGTWLPIDTAPRDGRPLLLFSPDAADQIPSICFWAEYDGEGCWADIWSIRELDAAPTHWMALPAPPPHA